MNQGSFSDLDEERENKVIQQTLSNTPLEQLTSEEQQAAEIISSGNEVSKDQLETLIANAEQSSVPVQEYETSIKIRVPNYITNPDKYDVVLLAAEDAMPNAIRAIKSRKLLYELAKKAFIGYAKTIKLGTGQYSVGSRGLAAASRGLSSTRKLASRGFSTASSAASRGFSRASEGLSGMRNRFSPTNTQQYSPAAPQQKKWFGLFGGSTRRRKHKSKRSKKHKTRKH